MAATADLLREKLQAEYPTGDKNIGALLQRYRADNILQEYEDYVDHLSPSALGALGGLAATTPDHASFAVADLDVRILVKLDDWTPGFTHWFIAQGDHIFTLDLAWTFSLHQNGALRTAVTADGVNFVGPESVPLDWTNGSTHWLRTTVDTNNGAGGKDFAYYTSVDGVVWDQIGTTITQAGTIALRNSAQPLAIPGQFGTVVQHTLYAELRSAINGSIVANPDFRVQNPGTTSFADSTGKTWTVTNNGVGTSGHVADNENAFWDAFVP